MSQEVRKIVLVSLNGNLLELKIVGDPNPREFQETIQSIKKVPGRQYQDYTWTIPKEQVDSLIKNVSNTTRIVWQTPISKIKNIEKEPVLPDFKVSNKYLDDFILTPYPFQTIGISFLHDVEKCLIADEMGLGKTIQIMGAIWKLYKEGKVKKALVICPSSLKYQWREEIEKFLGDKAECTVIDGNAKKRKEVYGEINNMSCLFTIINYELVRNDIEDLKELHFDCIAADEIHRIKSWTSKTSLAIKELDAPYKFGSTGTPMQNKPEEIFNIFAFLNPDILGNWWYFRKRYVVIGTKFKQKNVVLGYDNLDELHDKLAKYMLRRLKTEVTPELPEMIINNYLVPMTDKQIRAHEEIRENLVSLIKEVSEFNEYDENGNLVKEHPKAGQILGMFTMMQEICDSPELLQMSDSKMAQRYAINDTKSPKLDELVNIIKDILENDSAAKIVIFTQFERMQRLIVDKISKLANCTVLNGKMNAVERQKSINNFTMGDAQIFISTDAGNYGWTKGLARIS